MSEGDVLSVLDMQGRRVYSSRGRAVGRVAEAIFLPNGKQLIGFVVERPRLFGLLDRKDRYLSFDRCRVSAKRVDVVDDRGAWGSAAERRAGFNWDSAVIWVGMPVRTRSGEVLGSVRDVLVETATGEVSAIGLSGGITADIAVGVRDVPAGMVEGFDGSAVVVEDSAGSIDTSGGAAQAAGRGAAIAKKAGSNAAKKAVDAGKTAAAYGASAVRVAAKSETGKKARRWLKGIKDEIVDAMGDPDDD